jgi:hypothetical protein
MRNLQRISPLAIATCAVIGGGFGLLVQLYRSTRGQAPLVPSLSLTFTLLVFGAVVLVLAISLRRAVTRKSGKAVNPFHAVRLLAGARTAQFTGALIGGFGGGLALQLLTRSVMPQASTWVPMLLVLGAGAALVGCGIVAEMLCRVPPADDDGGESEQQRGIAPHPDPAPGAA